MGISDINQAIKYIKKNNNKISILHCVSSYPTKYEDLNLNVINKLKKNIDMKLAFLIIHSVLKLNSSSYIRSYNNRETYNS